MDYEDYRLLAGEEIHFWHRAKNNLIHALLKRVFRISGKKDKEILDIGCGTGTEIKIIKNFGKVTALDNNREALAIAGSLTDIIYADIEEYELGKEKYDAVCAFDIFEHLRNDKDVTLKIYDSLKPGGHLLFSVPAFRFLFGPHDIALKHFRRYNKKELENTLTRAGFDIIRIGYWNSILFPLEAIFRIIKKMLYKKNHKKPGSEASVPPKVINGFLFRILDSENILINKNINFPFGLSIYGIAKKQN